MTESVKEILECSLNYCANVLKDNKPSEGFHIESVLRDKVHDQRMKSNNRQEETILTEEMFEDAVSRFKKKNKKCYDFVTKSGAMLKEAVFYFN